MKAALPIIAALSLAACSTTSPGIEVRTVEVPTPVPCLAREDIPAEPERVAGSLTGQAASDLKIISASALKLRAWGQELHSALTACAQ